VVSLLRHEGLYKKLRELCGWDAVSVRCQLPTEDMDALVSVTSDDDLASVLNLDEYDVAAARRNQQLRKIRVFLHPPAGARTPRAPSTLPLASHRRPPGHALMHKTGAGPSRPVRFVLLPPIARFSGQTRALLSITSSNNITRMQREEEEDVFPQLCSRSYVRSLCFLLTSRFLLYCTIQNSRNSFFFAGK
jgi:hypothetical protein